MAQEKLTFEQFLEGVDAQWQTFTQELHNYLLDNGCKAIFEAKKTGLLGSYKYNKRAVINLLRKKHGLLVRIYGENLNGYRDFLNTLTAEMVQSINGASICKRIVNNTCSPKCTGYDFTIGNEHFQKCRYNCFEFLVTKESAPFIRSFVEYELKERTAA